MYVACDVRSQDLLMLEGLFNSQCLISSSQDIVFSSLLAFSNFSFYEQHYSSLKIDLSLKVSCISITAEVWLAILIKFGIMCYLYTNPRAN